MKKGCLIPIILVLMMTFSSCKKCNNDVLDNIRYVGIYVEVVPKHQNERSMDDVNPKLYVDDKGILNDKKNSYEYRIEATKFGPNQYQTEDYVVCDFGVSYSLFINNNNTDVEKVDIYPVVYDQTGTLCILNEKIKTMELADQVAKTMTYEKSYVYNGEKRYIKISMNITKKIVG